jgi:hypothetical protein
MWLTPLDEKGNAAHADGPIPSIRENGEVPLIYLNRFHLLVETGFAGRSAIRARVPQSSVLPGL